jgi:hypothetical protein
VSSKRAETLVAVLRCLRRYVRDIAEERAHHQREAGGSAGCVAPTSEEYEQEEGEDDAHRPIVRLSADECVGRSHWEDILAGVVAAAHRAYLGYTGLPLHVPLDE